MPQSSPVAASDSPKPEPIPSDPAQTGYSVRNRTAMFAGGFTDVFCKQAMTPLTNPVFHLHLGVEPVLLGAAQGAARLWDAITDPLVGVISDRTRSRWGRRRPFVFVGAILSGITFAAIWMFPEGRTPAFYFAWFVVASFIYFAADTLFSVPFKAMSYEVTDDHHQRTKVMGYVSFAGSLATVPVHWLFALTKLEIFADTGEGARWAGVIGGITIALVGIIPALLLRERPAVAATTSAPRIKIGWGALFQALRLKPLRLVMALAILLLVAFYMVYGLGMYINIYHVFDGDERKASILQGWIGTVQHVGALLAVAPIVWVARRIGKSRTIALCLGCTFLGHLSKLITFRPENPWWELASAAMLAPGVTAVFLLCNSLLADICDLDELQSGQRREGTIGAVYSWGTKVGLSLGFVLAGIGLVLSGFARELGVNQEPGTIWKLRLMFAGVPAVAVLGCIFMALRIRVDAATMGDVQATLRARRALG